MDPILVKGLREAKQLLDDGILSPAEFEKEKAVLLQKRDIRVQREQQRARDDPERRYRSDGANNTFCSRCGLPGHNKRSCTEDLEAMGGKKRRRKSKWTEINGKRGPAKPRWSREPTCYALFFGAELKKMKAEDGDKKLKISDAAKVVAAKWKTMSEEDKLKWKREKAAEEGEGSSSVVLGMAGIQSMGASGIPMGISGVGVGTVGGSQPVISAAHPQPPAPPGDPAPPLSASTAVSVQPPPPAK